MSFYQRREWRDLRYRVLRKYGFKCMACNSNRDEGKKIHVDHIKPISEFPELALCESNLQVLCEDCNLGKSNRYQDDLRHDPNVITKISQVPKSQRKMTARARLSRMIVKKIGKAEECGDVLALTQAIKAYLKLSRRDLHQRAAQAEKEIAMAGA